MAKPAPGKKFRYDLEAVLKVRGIREKKEQEKFAEKKREYLKEKEKEEAIEKEKKGKEEELRKIFRRGPISDFEKVLRRRAHLDVLKDDLDEQVERVIEASRILEEQRARLVEAMKDKKIMEKHKERKFEEYKKIMQELELKFMDEIATQRFKHEKEG
ncbi:MAG: flagellar export protein FliJ [Candidatus Margulisiibacteriota bacterium]